MEKKVKKAKAKKVVDTKKEELKPIEIEEPVELKLEEKEPEAVFVEPIEEVVEKINKDKNDPKKEFVKDWRDLVEVEGHKLTDRGKLYYGVKKK